MASVNKTIIVGNACATPELKYAPGGTAFCTLSIATNRSWKDKQSGEKKEEVEFHRVVFNDKLAEIVGQYVQKGKPIYVEGRLRTRKWVNKEGVEVYTTEIIANEMQLLGGRDSEDSVQPSARAPAPAPRQPAPRGPGSAAHMGNAGAPARSSTGFDDMDDDIPF